jgi:predicted nucleic acid-binding protein
MSLTVFLDSSPLSVLSNPKRPPETVRVLAWAVAMQRAGHRLVVPAIADYEVRRELERAGKVKSLSALNAWNAARPDRYLKLSDSALKLASKLWAQARKSGVATADPKELDGDVLIAAQALDTGISTSDFVIATVNVGHLARFAPAAAWQNIKP